MVEFAIVAPLLLLLLLGIGELGRAFFQYNTLTKSVREGARHLAGQAGGALGVVVLTDQLRKETMSMVAYGFPTGRGEPLISGLSPQDVSIEVLDSVNVRVIANYQYSPAVVEVLPGFGYGQGVPLTFTLTASTTMRIL